MNQIYRDQIAAEFRNCVTNTIQRIQGEATNRPFHSALLSEEALFWSRFERSFSTSFGQRVIEELARIVALSNGAIIAKSTLSDCVLITEEYAHIIEESDPKSFYCGDFTPGRYAWVLKDIMPITPIKATGKLGIWYFDSK